MPDTNSASRTSDAGRAQQCLTRTPGILHRSVVSPRRVTELTRSTGTVEIRDLAVPIPALRYGVEGRPRGGSRYRESTQGWAALLRDLEARGPAQDTE